MGSIGAGYIEAIVQTGETETAYRRAGRGRPVLLLMGASSPEGDEVFRRLAGTALVIEPRAVPAPDLWPDWLRGVVDGLGLDRPDLVVSPALSAAAEAFALLDPERVGRVLRTDTIDR